MGISPVYKCSICGKEYDNENSAIECSNTPKRKHKYKIGSVVSVKMIDYALPYSAIIERADEYDGHEPKYIIDPRNGICTYDIRESQIVEEVMSLECFNKRESELDAFIDECRHSAQRIFGGNCKVKDYSKLDLDNDNHIAKIILYIEK